MRLVFLGPPGAGKGTQAQRLAVQRGWAHVSTGDILRAEVKAESELGVAARAYMDRGELIPDDIMCEVVVKRLAQADCESGFILDGFPRTRVQADALDRTLQQRGGGLDRCVYFHLAREILRDRMTGRLNCKGCGAIYHRRTNPPKGNPMACDRCGSGLYQRDDDKDESVDKRLAVYEAKTRELVAYFRGQGRLLQIDAEGTMDEVTQRLADGLVHS